MRLKELDLHITNRCTTSCKYCCFSANEKKLEELDFGEIKSVVNDSIELGCEHVHITGGEPLIREDIVGIISYISNKGLECRLQTNGTLLTEGLLSQLMKAGLGSIMVSLDSYKREVNDFMRGHGMYDATIRVIELLKKSGIEYRVNSVLTKANYKDIPKTIDFVYSLGVKNYSAFYFSPIGTGRHYMDYWIAPSDYMKIIKELNSRWLHMKSGMSDMNVVIEKGYSSWEEAKSINVAAFGGCGGGCINSYNKREYMIVRCDGNVYPCIMAIDSAPLGNVCNTSIGDIYRNSVVWNDLLAIESDECSSCERFSICGGGCTYYPVARNSGHDGRCEMNRIVPLCPIMKYNYLNNKMGGSSDEVMHSMGEL